MSHYHSSSTLFNPKRQLPSSNQRLLISLSHTQFELNLPLSSKDSLCFLSFPKTHQEKIAKFAEVMAEEEAKKVEPDVCSEPPPAVEAPKDVAEEKSIIPPPPAEEKVEEDCKALAIVEKPEVAEEKKPEACDRDIALARVATEKRLSLITAWEESEKSKAENKAQKKISAIAAWENSKKASLDAELKKLEEELEKKKAEYKEKMQNKCALVHKKAEEKRANVEAKRGEEILKTEEVAAKCRASGTAPKKMLSFF